MGILRKTVLATTLIGAGLASTTGAAFASPHHDDAQHGVANVDSVQPVVPANVCNNDVPVNVLGVQVPVEDVSAAVPVGSNGDAAAQPETQVCGNDVDADAN